jgi:hypothetical protein
VVSVSSTPVPSAVRIYFRIYIYCILNLPTHNEQHSYAYGSIPNHLQIIILRSALKSATGNATTVLGWSNGMNPYSDYKLGVIEEQAYVDLIVVDGDPLADITSLKRGKIKVVLKDGKCYKCTLGDDALEAVNK